MKVFTVICVHARETNTIQEWICSVWNVHIQIILKVISFSILNMHELVETTGCHSQMHTFPDQMNWHFVQILMDSKFQSTVHALDTDDVAQILVGVLQRSFGGKSLLASISSHLLCLLFCVICMGNCSWFIWALHEYNMKMCPWLSAAKSTLPSCLETQNAPWPNATWGHCRTPIFIWLRPRTVHVMRPRYAIINSLRSRPSPARFARIIYLFFW